MPVSEKRSRGSYFLVIILVTTVSSAYLALHQYKKQWNWGLSPRADDLGLLTRPLKPPVDFSSKNGAKLFVAPPSSAPPSFQTVDKIVKLIDVKAESKDRKEHILQSNIITTSSNPDLFDYVSKYPRPPSSLKSDLKVVENVALKSESHCESSDEISGGAKNFQRTLRPAKKDYPTSVRVKNDEMTDNESTGLNSKIIHRIVGNYFKDRIFGAGLIFGQYTTDFAKYSSRLIHDLAGFCEILVGARSAWVWTIICSIAVMLTGVIPALLISDQCNNENSDGLSRSSITPIQLNRLLCFAVGSLLGDVFFHLLPESWAGYDTLSNGYVGMWLLAGLITCLVIEKFCAQSESSQHYVAALANLAANIMDNFTHGLAVGGSFLVSTRLGFLTTFAILLHEIPHEISDFAILLRADFNRRSAIKAQLITAFGGIAGAAVALMNDKSSSMDSDHRSSWILPFTAGGFLNIALIQVLPDLLKEKNCRENFTHLLFIGSGICIMGLLNLSLHV